MDLPGREHRSNLAAVVDGVVLVWGHITKHTIIWPLFSTNEIKQMVPIVILSFSKFLLFSLFYCLLSFGPQVCLATPYVCLVSCSVYCLLSSVPVFVTWWAGLPRYDSNVSDDSDDSQTSRQRQQHGYTRQQTARFSGISNLPSSIHVALQYCFRYVYYGLL